LFSYQQPPEREAVSIFVNMTAITFLSSSMLLVIVLLAIAIHRTGKSNKLLHEKNKRERIREQANES
jgi:hypothetical protein